jgi:hypothetical protein
MQLSADIVGLGSNKVAATLTNRTKMFRASEQQVQFRERFLAVLYRVLRDAVVVTQPEARLHELHRQILPDQAHAILLVLVDVGIGVRPLERQLEVVALAIPPVRFDSA